MPWLWVFTLSHLAVFGTALNNGVARTPPMGWLQWERFRCITDCQTYPDQCISESLFQQMADHMVADGYLEAGYEYVNIDDCWPEHQRDKNLNFVADQTRFPHGISALADYVHSKGLKLGIYTDFGTYTCGGYPGSIFHMQKDSEIFAQWGVDMLKVDGCYACTDLMPEGYKAFGQYLNATDRKMVYSCSWPAYIDTGKPYKDIAPLCNMWRNWDDIQDSWDSVLSIINYNGDHQDEIIPYVGPGNFNDPDMLLIGDYSLSEDQSKAQFALWAIMAAPLFMSADLRTMKQWQKDILLNSEVIAVDQDPLGVMGKRIFKSNIQQTWAKPLANNSIAVAILSLRQDYPDFMSVQFSDLGAKGPFLVRDLFTHQDKGVFSTSYTALVNPQGVVMLKLSSQQRQVEKDEHIHFHGIP